MAFTQPYENFLHRIHFYQDPAITHYPRSKGSFDQIAKNGGCDLWLKADTTARATLKTLSMLSGIPADHLSLHVAEEQSANRFDYIHLIKKISPTSAVLPVLQSFLPRSRPPSDSDVDAPFLSVKVQPCKDPDHCPPVISVREGDSPYSPRTYVPIHPGMTGRQIKEAIFARGISFKGTKVNAESTIEEVGIQAGSSLSATPYRSTDECLP